VDVALRRAWTEIVTASDYEQHMSAIGQAQAAAELTCWILGSARLPQGARIVIAGAGTGQMLDYLDADTLRPFRLTCTDLNRSYLERLRQRLDRHSLNACLLIDDFEQSAIAPGCDLLLATLLLEHIDWMRGVETIARIRPSACGIVIQENPPGMDSAITPGRRLPQSIELALRSAHSTLIPRQELIETLRLAGYAHQSTFDRPVADGKRLLGLLFRSQANLARLE
jgi:hypothetical protein